MQYFDFAGVTIFLTPGQLGDIVEFDLISLGESSGLGYITRQHRSDDENFGVGTRGKNAALSRIPGKRPNLVYAVATHSPSTAVDATVRAEMATPAVVRPLDYGCVTGGGHEGRMGQD